MLNKTYKGEFGAFSQVALMMEMMQGYDVSRGASQQFLSCAVYHTLATFLSQGSSDFFCNGWIVNVIDFVGQKAKWRILYKYLYNKKESKFSQVFH